MVGTEGDCSEVWIRGGGVEEEDEWGGLLGLSFHDDMMSLEWLSDGEFRARGGGGCSPLERGASESNLAEEERNCVCRNRREVRVNDGWRGRSRERMRVEKQ